MTPSIVPSMWSRCSQGHRDELDLQHHWQGFIALGTWTHIESTVPFKPDEQARNTTTT